jgi:GntR family transcriptional regulator
MAARVANSLREELRHEYIVGGRLPSEPDLATQFGVSRGTVRHALAVLEREGVIIRRQGAGTYVHYISRAQTRAEHAYEFTELLRSAGFEPGIQLNTFAYEPLSEEEAARLNLEPGASALVVHKTFLANDRPAIYCIDSIPKDLIVSPFDDDELNCPIFEFMRERCHQVTVQNLAELIPIVATHELAALLEVEPGTPLLRIDEVGYNAEGKAVILHSACYRDQFIRFSLLRKRI